MTDDEDDDDSTDEHHSEPNNLLPEHYNYMSFRENMQEFPGRVPTRKRKKDPENPQQDSNKPKVRRKKTIFCSTWRSETIAGNLPLSKIINPEKKWKGREEGKKTFTILTPNGFCIARLSFSYLIYFVIIIVIIEKT